MKYDADKVYQIIRRDKIPYNTLTKDSVIEIIVNSEKNIKSVVPNAFRQAVKSSFEDRKKKTEPKEKTK